MHEPHSLRTACSLIHILSEAFLAIAKQHNLGSQVDDRWEFSTADVQEVKQVIVQRKATPQPPQT